MLAGLVEIGLRVLPLPKLCAALGIRFGMSRRPEEAVPLAAAQRKRVAEASRQVDWIVERGPRRGRCLRRSLMLGHLLRELHPVVRIGVAKSAPGIEAHAWVEIGGVAVSESQDRVFVPLCGHVGS